jgi:hypothetical protein
MKIPKWPETMPVLETTEFVHGTYEERLHENGTVCGTMHCAVGHLAVAFGMNATPYRGPTPWGYHCGGRYGHAALGTPMQEFAFSFAKHLGANMRRFKREYEFQGLFALECVFESGSFREGRKVPSEAATARAWNAAIKECGYTEVIDRG